MKIEGYMCDCGCGRIFLSSEIIGIVPVEDAFDKQSSFPTKFTHPERLDIHYSLTCYREKVLIPASNLANRRKNEREYELKVKELAYGLRAQCVMNFRKRKTKHLQD